MKKLFTLGLLVGLVSQANAVTVEQGSVAIEANASSSAVLYTETSASPVVVKDSSYKITSMRSFKKRMQYILSSKHYPQFNQIEQTNKASHKAVYKVSTDWSLGSVPVLFKYNVQRMDESFQIQSPWSFSWSEIYRSYIFQPSSRSIELSQRMLHQSS